MSAVLHTVLHFTSTLIHYGLIMFQHNCGTIYCVYLGCWTSLDQEGSRLCETWSICVIEISCYEESLQVNTGRSRGEAGDNKRSGSLDADESWTAGLQNYNDKTRHGVADQTQQQAGGTSNISCARCGGEQEHRSTCTCAPPTDGWEVLGRCVFAWMSASTVYLRVSVCLLCMTGCTRLSEEPINCSRLRRSRRAQTSRLFRFGDGTNLPSLPESAKSISHL